MKEDLFICIRRLLLRRDAEGAGEMFKVTTLPLDNTPKNEDGSVNFKDDFFGRATNLTVSGQLEGELARWPLVKFILLVQRFVQKIETRPGILRSFG